MADEVIDQAQEGAIVVQDQAALVLQAHQARLNITWSGSNGDLVDPVPYDSADGDVKQWATEAVRNGDIPGIQADAAANFQDFVVDRFPANDEVPFNRLFLRPKTPFGVDPKLRLF